MKNSIDETTQNFYRDCFRTPSGRKVLGHMLADMGLWDDNLKTEEETAVANYAKKILRRMGVIGIKNLDYYADMFADAPLIRKDKDDGTSE